MTVTFYWYYELQFPAHGRWKSLADARVSVVAGSTRLYPAAVP